MKLIGDDLHVQAYFAGARCAGGEIIPPFHRALTESEVDSFWEGFADHGDVREFAQAHSRDRLPEPFRSRLPNTRSSVQDRRHDDEADAGPPSDAPLIERHTA